MSNTFDLIIAGAGPAGSAAAIRAASAGLSVALLDKASQFPRTKACGDALTPLAVEALHRLGVPLPPGTQPVRGLAAWGEADHPQLYPWPGHLTQSVTVPRDRLDAHLLEAARQAGAHVQLGETITGLRLDGDRCRGLMTASGQWLAPVVIDAAGASSRLGAAAGMPRLASRPSGVAVRGYMTGAPEATGPWLHLWLALSGADRRPLPGYGWVFPLGDGLYNVGVGQLSTSATYQKTNYRELLQEWVATLPPEWQLRWLRPDSGPVITGAMLPMGLDRRLVYRRGVLLTGDAAGLVNPFNGEGVSYALESGDMAGRAVAQAARAGFGTAAAEAALQGYHQAIKARYGRYFWAGNLFTVLMGNQAFLDACVRYGLPRRAVMRVVNKLMANLIAPTGGPLDDRILRTALRIVPSA